MSSSPSRPPAQDAAILGRASDISSPLGVLILIGACDVVNGPPLALGAIVTLSIPGT
jgi:hypothetical protein